MTELAPEFSWIQLTALSALVFFAGFVDALAGGGGLITLPAYLATGLPPSLLLGTNKLSSSIGTVASALRYSRALSLSVRPLLPATLAAVVGSLAGARAALGMNPQWLRYFLLAALPLLAYFIYSRHEFGAADRSETLPAPSRQRRSVAVSLPIGAYDGFFGPGTGTFLALAFVRFGRYDLLGATARAKWINLATNLAALCAFLAAGTVHIALGAAMGFFSVTGHWAGSHVGLSGGSREIRPAVACVCALLFAKLFYDAFSGPAYGF